MNNINMIANIDDIRDNLRRVGNKSVEFCDFARMTDSWYVKAVPSNLYYLGLIENDADLFCVSKNHQTLLNILNGFALNRKLVKKYTNVVEEDYPEDPEEAALAMFYFSYVNTFIQGYTQTGPRFKGIKEVDGRLQHLWAEENLKKGNQMSCGK